MDDNQLTILLEKYLLGTATNTEKEELHAWYRAHDLSNVEWPADDPDEEIEVLSRIYEKILLQTAGKEVPVIQHPAARSRSKWWVAASVIILLGLGAYLWIHFYEAKNHKDAEQIATADPVLPGKQGAILTLADGRQLVLDSINNGQVAIQQGSSVNLENGSLRYDPSVATQGSTYINIMTTPRGRQFQLTLSDGTKVWLNAASSIRYPAVFTGKERVVDITGEVYFEVAKNRQMPFRVNVTGRAEIEVLGTNFNVNAYENEEILNTTLLEGRVKVNGTTINPGQQAQIANDRTARLPAVKIVDNADLDKAMAWKHGLFNFENASLKDVMHQLERWYDIDVVYEKDIPAIEFGGKLTKDIPLSDLLVVLEKSKVHFRIEGRKLIVLR